MFLFCFITVRKYPPKERVNLSLSEKITIIDEYENGPIKSQRKIADKYNVSKSTVAEMLRNKVVLKNAYMLNANTKRKRFNSQSRYADINALVWTWYKNAREAGIQMSGPMIQEKALQLAKDLQMPVFKASNGWLHSWKSRYNITSFKDEATETGGVKPAIIRDFSKVEGTAPPGSDMEAANSILSFGSPMFNFIPLAGAESSTAENQNTYIDETVNKITQDMLACAENNENGDEESNTADDIDIKMELSVKSETNSNDT